MKHVKAARPLFALLILAIGLCALTSPPLRGVVLIQVDVSNPEAVVFTSTGNAPLVLNEATRLFQGVILQDFFPAGSNQGEGFTEEVFATNSALGPTNDSGDLIPFDIALITPGSPDLAIAHDGRFGGAYRIFDPASAAFSGSLILDLSDYMLPSGGQSARFRRIPFWLRTSASANQISSANGR